MLVAAVATATAGFAAPKCATQADVTAIQAAAVQQELMVAALTCNDVTNFNAFQTSFSSELRSSDQRLMSMFRRLYGARRGSAEYHAFKTRLANSSSMRSIHDNASYCRETQTVFAAALAPEKPALSDFVSGVAVHEDSPVDSCEIRVATGLAGLKGAPGVTPKPNPLRMAALTPAPVAPAAVGGMPADGAPAAQTGDAAIMGPAAAQQPDVTAPAAQADAAASVKPAEKKQSGWLSGLFN